MALQNTYVFQGKEFTAWAENQLTSINRDALKKRAMDIREHVGADNLPPMPQHPEGLVTWILEVQGLLQGHTAPPQSAAPPSSMGGRGHGGGSQHGYAPSDNGSAMTEDQQAYRDANNAAKASRDRNRGSGIF
mmetsp:Transcript_85624/g.245753  ORF Transcript_85624/g.245753 Transcript_85624/m.245753 type:complete len:133 (-) Transcript_85624:192-590(-)